MEELQSPYIEFETGKETTGPRDVGVVFEYIPGYFPPVMGRDPHPEGNRYYSKKLRYEKDPNGGLSELRSITIIGASGAMGSEIAKRILTEQPLPKCDKIQLFGRPKDISQGKDRNFYYAMIEKLRDGMGGVLPQIEFIDSYESVDGELLIMCAGKTISKEAEKAVDRTVLRHENMSIFKSCARGIRDNPFRSPQFVIVVSNPNELCTSVFSAYFKRVVAIGPVIDSMRFQREIRDDLSLSADIPVDVLAGGNHELKGMVLYKSMLRINCKSPSTQLVARISPTSEEDPDVGMVYEKAYGMVKSGDKGVFDYINSHSIPIRLAIKPLIEYFCGGRADFPVGIAVISTIKTLQDSARTFITLTKKTRIGGDEVCIGIPLFVSRDGLEEIELDSVENFREYGDDEQLLIAAGMFRSKYLNQN